jgi:hypothetical protein
VNLAQAFAWNVGTSALMRREKFKRKHRENQSTNAVRWDGLGRSSDESFVMKVERRPWIIQQ